MLFRSHHDTEREAIIDCFIDTFSDSEGETEGEIIGGLARNLFETTPLQDLLNFVAEEDGQIVGSIFLTRLDFHNDLVAFLLAPVAVHPNYQNRGVGQGLIQYGLQTLIDHAIEIVLTYGDPSFYCKVGFQSIAEESIRPPFKLTQPEGWLGQSLADLSISSVKGRVRCVKALDSSEYW